MVIIKIIIDLLLCGLIIGIPVWTGLIIAGIAIVASNRDLNKTQNN